MLSILDFIDDLSSWYLIFSCENVKDRIVVFSLDKSMVTMLIPAGRCSLSTTDFGETYVLAANAVFFIAPFLVSIKCMQKRAIFAIQLIKIPSNIREQNFYVYLKDVGGLMYKRENAVALKNT